MPPSSHDLAVQLAQEIEAAHVKKLQWLKSNSAWASWRASGLSDECERRVYYRRVHADYFPPIGDGLAGVFHAGNLLEPAIKRHLSEMGYEVVAAQLSFPANPQNITGHIDGILEYKDHRFVAEVKTVGYAFDKLHSADDLKNGGGFLAKWYGQMMLYLYLAEIEAGVIILYEKQGGRIRVLPVSLDYQEAEELLRRAERLNEALASGNPPPHLTDWAICKKCPILEACQPPIVSANKEVKVITDPEILDLADTMTASREAYYQYEKSKKALQAALRGVEQADLGGKYVVTGAWSSLTTYDVPDELKAPYKKVNPQGRFIMKIEPVDGGADPS